MAIRYRESSRTWQVYWNNPFSGKRESKTFADKKEAEKENSLVQYRLKYERESFRPAEEETPKQEFTLEQVFLEYLKEKKFSERDFSTLLSHMKPALSRIGEMPVRSITKDILEDLKKHLSKTVSQTTTHVRLAHLRAVLYWAVDKGYCEQIRFPKIESARYTQFVPPSQEELTAIYAVAPPHIQRVIVIGAYMGARVGQCELFQLTWQDVDFSKGVLRIHGSKKNKNAPSREVPIREDLLPFFRQWHADDMVKGIEFLIHYRGEKVTTIGKGWRAALKRAGIERRIRPYDLRHAFGTELIAAGVDVGTVAKLMGHSNPVMLLTHYQYVMDRQKKEAIESLPKFGHVPDACASEKRDEKTGVE